MRAADNPFSVDRIHQLRYRPRAWEWDQLLDRLATLRFRAAIVGPEGSGKTTLMEDLADRLRQRGLRPQELTLNRQDRRIDPGLIRWLDTQAGPVDVLCFDGCEQLGPIRWHLFLARCKRLGGLLITTHSPGRLPTLVACDTDPQLLLDLIRTLKTDEPLTTADAARLLQKHQGNIRHALREMYDRAWEAVRSAPLSPASGWVDPRKAGS